MWWNWTGSDPQALFVDNTRLIRSNVMEEQFADVMESALDIGQFVSDGMYATTTSNGKTTYSLKNPVPGTWPTTNRLAAQMHSVAAMIAARQSLGASRQIFFVSLGGFDNHGDQFGRDASTGNKTLLAGKHYDLLREFDAAMKVFYDATDAMGVASSVTTMTMSDFGRTLKSNGQGSDHGCGEHLMVMGGAVNGGRIVGQMPPVALGTDVDVGEGRLLPTTASDSYAASFAKWLGATDAELDFLFPTISGASPRARSTCSRRCRRRGLDRAPQLPMRQSARRKRTRNLSWESVLRSLILPCRSAATTMLTIAFPVPMAEVANQPPCAIRLPLR